MVTVLYEIIQGIILFIPAFIANPGAVVTGGKGKMDFGKNFLDGRRIFGDGKTISGFFGGSFIGIITGMIIFTTILETSVLKINYGAGLYIALIPISAMSFGSMAGDLMGSFVKRRIGMKNGSKGNLLDQWPFVIVATLFIFLSSPSFFYSAYPYLIPIIFILILTPPLHRLVNIIAFKMHRKDVPW
ncbi:MAG: CDP-2,3-bis-(O-geranylgeranyl)-sn-glycerol synthase [Thermoplasmataceae archaeon]